MKKFTCMVTLACSFAFTAMKVEAKSPEAFFKRFQVMRNSEGKLLGIRDLSMPTKFEVAPYVTFIKKYLLNEQKLLTANGFSKNYDANIKELLNADSESGFYPLSRENSPGYNKNVDRVIESLKQLAVVNVEGVFGNENFKNVVSKFEGKIDEALKLLDPSMLANVNDPTYFYKKNVTYKAVTWALDFAQKTLTNVPMLNTVSYVVVEVEKLITERRQFHQNMLLHYLENFKEEELGLTHDEVNMIWSSIYESKIQWFAFWESNNAKDNWLKYGASNFYGTFRAGTKSLEASASLYSTIGKRVNYAFQNVQLNNENVMINLLDNESSFHNKPAVAYNFDQPTQIARKRMVLNLAQLGLSFVPFPGMIKDAVSNFIKSFYESQKITEGALYGYFESMNDLEGQGVIKAQYLNPFDSLVLN